MNKTELAKKIAKKAGMSQANTEKLVNALVETVSDELKNKEKVTLVGFGTFGVAHRKEKIGVNPKTGEKIKIKAKDVPVFKAGKGLKEKVK